MARLYPKYGYENIAWNVDIIPVHLVTTYRNEVDTISIIEAYLWGM